MSRPRTCPNCLVVIGLEDGFHFSANLSMICDVCGKPVVPTEWQDEQIIDTSIRNRKAESWNKSPYVAPYTAPLSPTHHKSWTSPGVNLPIVNDPTKQVGPHQQDYDPTRPHPYDHLY